MKKWSLSIRLFIVFFAVILIPGLILGIVANHSLQSKMMEQVEKGNRNIAILFVNSLNYYVEELEQMTLTPYHSPEILRLIRNIDKGGVGKDVAMNRLALELPKMFITANKQVQEIGFAFQDTDFIRMDKNTGVEILSNYEQSDYNSWVNDMLFSDQHIYYLGQDSPTLFNEYHKLSVMRVIKDYHSSERLAIMYASIETALLDELIDEVGVGGERIIEVTSNDKIIYSSSNSILNKNHYSKNIFPCDNGWHVEILTPIDLVENQVKEIMKVYTYGFIVFMILICLIYIVVVKKVSTPFHKLMKQMENIGEHKQGKISIDTNIIEVNLLEKKLNQMHSKMSEYIAKEYQHIIAEKNAEYQALQAQINPHFLYNTFNGFMTLNRLGERKKLNNSMRALIKMMRYIFEKEQKATLNSEMESIKQYLHLSKMRFEQRLHYSCYVDQEIEDALLPKLILQPLVENAIVHGLEPISSRCNVFVNAYKIESPFEDGQDYIYIVIEDTGAGFDMKQWSMPEGEGLANVKQRLEFIYPKLIFNVFSEKHKGTRIQLVLPYVKGEVNNANLYHNR